MNPIAPLAPPVAPVAPVAANEAMPPGGQPMPLQPSASVAPVPEVRPPVPQRIAAATARWWTRTTDLPQRENALYEFREANKTLFPSRFNSNDPRRGQQTAETRRKRDTRRVQTPYVYRDTLQATAMTVPEDTDFDWSSRPQVEPVQTPQIDPMTGISTPPPTMASLDPMRGQFAATMKIVQRNLLDEAGFIEKAQAWVQDSGTYPLAVLKYCFRRDYNKSCLNPNSGNKDASEMMARFQALMQRYTAKQFDNTSAEYEEMIELLRGLAKKSAISQWYGIDLQLVPMSAFGISEDVLDKSNIYDATYMFHDAVLSGDELLAAYPYREETVEDMAGVAPEQADAGERVTYGVLPSELTKATPFLGNDNITDPLAGAGSTRGRGRTSTRGTNNSTTVTDSSKTGQDPRQQKFLVREVWHKPDRRVMVFVKGLDHMIESYVKESPSDLWYPFALFSPNRVPTEIYGCSDLELKRDIQARIHNKRTDEEKARELSLPRGIYNSAAGVDQNEMLKMSNIPAGHLKGINFGNSQQRIDDIVQWWKADFNPMSFDTSRDERDKDMMGALPVQAAGATGVANYAAEVQMAGAGMAIATKFRQGQVRRELERMLHALAQVLLQELTPSEVRQIAGPFAVWPEVYSDEEAKAILAEARERISTEMGPTLFEQVMVEIAMSGRPMEPAEVQALIDRSVAPAVTAEMMKRFGSPEPVSRESMFRRMQIRVKSTTTADMDRATNVQQLSMLSTAIQGIQAVAMAAQIPFDPKPIFRRHSALIGGDDTFDQMFPAVPPIQMAGAVAAQASATQQTSPQTAPKGQPEDQGARGNEVEPAQQARNGARGGAPTAAGPMPPRA